MEIDTDNIITLNKNESTLKFNNIGYYKISIILSASIYPTNPNFDSKNDFISYDFDKNTTSHSQQHLKRNYDYMMVILQNLYRDDFTLDGFSVWFPCIASVSFNTFP